MTFGNKRKNETTRPSEVEPARSNCTDRDHVHPQSGKGVPSLRYRVHGRGGGMAGVLRLPDPVSEVETSDNVSTAERCRTRKSNRAAADGSLFASPVWLRVDQ